MAVTSPCGVFLFRLSLLVVIEVLLFPLCSRCESVSTGWLGQSTVCKETWQHGSSCYFVFQLLSVLDAARLRFGPTDRDLHCWFHDSENRTRVSLCDFDQKFRDSWKAQQTNLILDKVNSNWSGCRDAACSWRVVLDEGSWWSVVEIEERLGSDVGSGSRGGDLQAKQPCWHNSLRAKQIVREDNTCHKGEGPHYSSMI
jgi:hypothetical protein